MPERVSCLSRSLLALGLVAGGCTSSTAPPSGSAPTLFVANTVSNSIGFFATDAPGNVAPTARIVGANTGLDAPVGITRDAAGRIYVTNQGNNSITIYAAGDAGNVSPVATIVGAGTGLNLPEGIAVDGAGNIYVANDNPTIPNATNSITVYAAGATGNAAPIATIVGANTILDRPRGVTVDASGKLYVTNWRGNSIVVFANLANGNVAPIDTIWGAATLLDHPARIARYASGGVVVTNEFDNTITIYAAGATGNAAPVALIGTLVGGDVTGMVQPIGVAIDPLGQLWVANNGSNALSMFPVGANGNLPPATVIAGGMTTLSGPNGITF